MADRDWSKELAKVDKQLASLSDDALLGTANQPPAKAGASAGAAAASAPRGNAPAPAPGGGERKTSAFGVYARVTLALALGVAMVVWPYENRCGVGLAGYMAAMGAMVVSGLWSAVWTWRHRAARAHTLSLLIVLFGLVLGALDVLPRIGYGKPDLRHPATWTCSNVPPAAPAPSPTPLPTTPTPTPTTPK
ncbi:MAG: hypothetical protein ACHQWU_12360 [Gemmatimonadales bacterium]